MPEVSNLSRQMAGAALTQAGSDFRKLQSPGLLLAAAAMQGDRLMSALFSQVRHVCRFLQCL